MEEILILTTKKFVDLTMKETDTLATNLKIFFTSKDKYIAEYLDTEDDSAVLIVWLIQNIEKNFKKLKKKTTNMLFKDMETTIVQDTSTEIMNDVIRILIKKERI